MATFLPPDIRQYVHQEAAFLCVRIATWSAAGNAKYGIDAVNAIDRGGVSQGATWGEGSWILQPAVTTVANRHRQIGATSTTPAHDNTNGYIYHTGADYNPVPVQNQRYEIWNISTQMLHQQMLKTNAEHPVPYFAPLERFTNANFQTNSGGSIASWTVVTSAGVAGAGTLVATTTAANVFDLNQAGLFSLGAANEKARSVAYSVDDNSTYDVYASFKVNTGGPFYLAIFNATTGVEIESGNRRSHSQSHYATVHRTFTTPAGCKSVYIDIIGTAATDVACLGYVNGPHKRGDNEIILPSSWGIKTGAQILMVQFATYTAQEDSDVYDTRSRVFEKPLLPKLDYTVRVAPASVNTGRIEFDKSVVLPRGEIHVQAIRYGSDFTTPLDTDAGEAVVFNGDVALFGKLLIRNLCQHIVTDLKPDDSRALAKLDLLDGPIGADGKRKGGELSDLLVLAARDEQPAAQQRTHVRMFPRGF